MAKKRKNRVASNILSLLMAAYCVLTIFIIIYMLMTSFKSRSDFIMNIFGFPKSFTLDNIAFVLGEGGLAKSFLNSIIITVSYIALSLLVGSMTAYGISRFDFKYRQSLYTYYIAGMIFPIMLALVPIFRLIRFLGLYNNLASLILIYTSSLSFSVFILTGFFKTLPLSLPESASIEGASELRIYFTIILPIAKPAIATVFIFQSIWSWNDMVLPMILLTRPALRTITLALLKFVGMVASDWLSIFTASTLAMLPVILIYLIFSEQIVKGLTAGSTK